MSIFYDRYFPHPVGLEAVEIEVAGDYPTFTGRLALNGAALTFSGDANSVMGALSTLSDKLAAAREALLTYQTEGTG